MEGNSVEILYRSPDTFGVWFAPETLLWLAVLLVAPFIVVWLLWQIAGPPFRAFAARNAATPKESYRAECAAKAYVHPGYQKTALAAIYAVLLMVSVGAAIIKLGHYNADHTSMYINTAPGLPAAAALLGIPALGLLLASIGAAAVGPYYGVAVAEAGFLPVIWRFAGAVGFGFAGIFSDVAGGTVVAVWEALAVVLFLAGLVLRASPTRAGRTVAEQARAAEQALQRHHVEQEAAQVEARGTYVGPAFYLHWGRILGTGLLPPVFFTGFFALAEQGAKNSALRDPGFWAFAFGAGLVFGGLIWLATRTRAREVQWEEQGVTVSWYAGQPRRFTWEELAVLKETTVEKGAEGAVVTAASGEKFTIASGNEGYDRLLLALEVHIWKREQV